MQRAWDVNVTLFRAYAKGLIILRELPAAFRDPSVVWKTMKHGESFFVEAPLGLVARYEAMMEATKSSVRTTAPPLPPFKNLQAMLFSVRILSMALALVGFPCLALLLSTLQYIIAPCSFFVSLAMFVALATPLFLGHYAVWGFLQPLSSALLPWWAQPSVPINLAFIVVLIALDQFLCLWLTVKTPSGNAAPLSAKTLFNHCWYGFLNCKTYELLILFCARSWGCRINLLVWLLDAHFGLSKRASEIAQRRLGTWAFLFYTQHRLGHLPKVYDSAHKFHHTFRDSTVFDAHIYGSGMPEELACIFVEALGASLGLCPMSLGHNGLTESWANKLGHTRKEDGAGGMNEHADHHREHVKNFGISNPMIDMLLGTRCDNDHAEFGTWEVKKTQEGEKVRFEWSPSACCTKDVMDLLYNPSLSRDMAEIARDTWKVIATGVGVPA